jgi:membrane fusion protein (multidrug efflux system)
MRWHQVAAADMRLCGCTALAVVFSLAACTPTKPAAKLPPPAVGVVTIREQSVALTVELPGRTAPFAVSEVRPQVSGIIKKRLFVEGATVEAGQPLYQIDPALYRAAWRRALANLASARSRAMRYADLTKVNAISAQAHDDARSAYELAQAEVEAARINLDYTTISAPITGRIGASAVTEGALVTALQAAPLATISTLDPIYVDIDQPSAELLALKRAIRSGRIDGGTPLSAPVRLKMEDGSLYPLEGRLQFTGVIVNPATGVVRLRAVIANPDGMLLPGMYVSAMITEGIDPHGILVPQHGVRRNERGEAVAFVVDARNIARLRVLHTGRAIGSNWQVMDGLKPGDSMIVEGLLKVKADMPVSPKPTAEGPGE